MREESNGDIIRYSYRNGIREELIEKKDGTRILKQYNLLKREFIDVTNKEMIENWLLTMYLKKKSN